MSRTVWVRLFASVVHSREAAVSTGRCGKMVYSRVVNSKLLHERHKYVSPVSHKVVSRLAKCVMQHILLLIPTLSIAVCYCESVINLQADLPTICSPFSV